MSILASFYIRIMILWYSSLARLMYMLEVDFCVEVKLNVKMEFCAEIKCSVKMQFYWEIEPAWVKIQPLIWIFCLRLLV